MHAGAAVLPDQEHGGWLCAVELGNRRIIMLVRLVGIQRIRPGQLLPDFGVMIFRQQTESDHAAGNDHRKPAALGKLRDERHQENTCGNGEAHCRQHEASQPVRATPR